MRVLLAPDGFGGTLTPLQAATAMAAGWRVASPQDELDLAPLSDGGPGLLDVLAAALPGAVRHPVTVEDPLARPVQAAVLLDGTTAYVEAAAAGRVTMEGSCARARWAGRRLAPAAPAGPPP